MRCPSCYARLHGRVQFCPDCGARIPLGMTRFSNAKQIVRFAGVLLVVVVIALFFLRPQLKNAAFNAASQVINNTILTASDLTTTSPATVLDNFCHDIIFHKYQSAYDSYSPRLQQKVSLLQFENSWSSKGKTNLKSIVECTHSAVSVKQNLARSTLIARDIYSETRTVYNVVLVKENHEWKIDSLTPQ